MQDVGKDTISSSSYDSSSEDSEFSFVKRAKMEMLSSTEEGFKNHYWQISGRILAGVFQHPPRWCTPTLICEHIGAFWRDESLENLSLLEFFVLLQPYLRPRILESSSPIRAMILQIFFRFFYQQNTFSIIYIGFSFDRTIFVNIQNNTPEFLSNL